MVPRDLILTDNTITLRLPTLKDVPGLVGAVRESVEEIMPWMNWCVPDYDDEMAGSWVASLPEAWDSGTQYSMVITDTCSGKILGGSGLSHINHQYRLANLGYWVRTSATGRGVATRAARLVAEFGINRVNLLRAEIVVAVENKPSLRVAEKCGAKREGLLRNRLSAHGKIFDAVMHSLTPQDFGVSP